MGDPYAVATTFPAGTILNAFERKNGSYKTQWRDANRFVHYVWVPTSAVAIVVLRVVIDARKVTVPIGQW